MRPLFFSAAELAFVKAAVARLVPTESAAALLGHAKADNKRCISSREAARVVTRP